MGSEGTFLIYFTSGEYFYRAIIDLKWDDVRGKDDWEREKVWKEFLKHAPRFVRGKLLKVETTDIIIIK